jgi:hypothetical protein
LLLLHKNSPGGARRLEDPRALATINHQSPRNTLFNLPKNRNLSLFSN